jgi:phage shock protein D
MIIIALMSYGPTRVTALLLRTVGRKPLRLLLAMVLEPLFRKGFTKLLGRYSQ